MLADTGACTCFVASKSRIFFAVSQHIDLSNSRLSLKHLHSDLSEIAWLYANVYSYLYLYQSFYGNVKGIVIPVCMIEGVSANVPLLLFPKLTFL